MTDTDVSESCLEALARHGEAERRAEDAHARLVLFAAAAGLSAAVFVAAVGALAIAAGAAAGAGGSGVGAGLAIPAGLVVGMLGATAAFALAGLGISIVAVVTAWTDWRNAVQAQDSALTELHGKCPPEFWP